MTVQFSDRFYDYVEFIWVDSIGTRFWVILSRVTFFLPLLVLAWIKPPQIDWTDFYLHPCVSCVGLAAFGGRYFWAWLRWLNRTSSEDQTTYEFSEMGLRSITPNTDVTLLWADLTGYRETSTLFLLRLPSGRYTFIPKRAFTDGAQQQAFRDLLSQVIWKQPTARTILPERSVGILLSRPFTLALTDYLESYNATAPKAMRLLTLILRGPLVVYVFWRVYKLIELSFYMLVEDTMGDPFRKWVALFLVWFAESLLLALLLCFAFNNYLLAFLQYRKQPKSQQVGMGDEGIRIQAGTVSSILKWEYLNKLVETQNLFLFCSRTRGAFLIPKRAFSAEHQQQCRTLLSQKLNQPDCN